MKTSSRRSFLQSSALLLGAGATGFSFAGHTTTPLLSFSTLGCPDWTFDRIMTFAKTNHYTGIELRGILHEMDLTKCKEFSTQNISTTRQQMMNNGLRFVNLGSSCTLHFPEGEERTKNLDEGKRFIDLAHKIDCPFVRVFPNLFPKEQSKEATLALMSQGLLQLAEHAQGSGVSVLIETHGSLVYTTDIVAVMKAANHKQTGLVWDVANMWLATGEAPQQVYLKLKPYIRHTHIKDAKKENNAIAYQLLGAGDVPIFEAIDLLRKDAYSGYYSFEWEKLWHPDIQEPDVALADYPLKMIKHFG